MISYSIHFLHLFNLSRTLRVIDVFIALGKDLDEVVHLTTEEFNAIPVGEPLK